MKIIVSLLAVLIIAIVSSSYAFAQSMHDTMPANDKMMGNNMSGWGNSSMPMHDNMHTGSMMTDKNMSGWGNGAMMNEGSMMSGGIDTSMGSPVLGSSSAPVTIVEFGDYQCPKCDAWFKNEESTVKSNLIDTNKAKLYFVDFPFLGDDSTTAAQAAYCAGDQGKYWDYHDYLYSHQGSIQSGWASASNLKSYASSLGLDTNKFNSCLDSGKYAQQVIHNKDIGTAKGVQGTPAFFIVSSSGAMQEIMGPQPAAIFSTTVDQVSTQSVPEFGTIAALILVMSIASIIVISKTGLRFTPKLK